MIQVQQLVKDFGARRAVDGVSFKVEPGTVLGFLGPNGAGKTTTIRMIAGYLPPSAGRITVYDCDVAKDPVAAQKLTGYMPENTPLYEDMTVVDFLRFVAEIRGFQGKEARQKADEAIDRCFLQAVRHQAVDTLSKGYRQRTCLAQALLHDPRVLLLDEPTEGLDPNQKQVVRDMISHMGKEKIVMLSTHVLEEVEAMCSRIIVISRGRIVADNTPAELKKRSADYHRLTVDLAAPADEAARVFGALDEVKQATVESRDEGRTRIVIVPTDESTPAPAVLSAARDNNWAVHDMHNHPGRLDDVFRALTVTDDVGEKARPAG